MNLLPHNFHLANGPPQSYSLLPPLWGNHILNPVLINYLLSFFIFFQLISTYSSVA